MGLIKGFGNFVKKYLFNPRWRCVNCGREVFNGESFCSKCYKTLPFNDGIICGHCGRKVKAPEEYCSTCKNRLTDVDLCRSAFNYEPPISTLIKDLKYKNHRFLAEIFSEYLANVYFKNLFAPDVITFVPMTKKAFRKRKFNQSELLAKFLSERVNVRVECLLEKKKDTLRQAETNSREERLKNLKSSFKVIDKKAVIDKKILIIDDVTTTGATAQCIAEKLKGAGAKTVYLLTVSSVPSVIGH